VTTDKQTGGLSVSSLAGQNRRDSNFRVALEIGAAAGRPAAAVIAARDVLVNKMRLHSSGVGSDAAGRSWRRSMGRVSRVLCVGVILVVLSTVVQCVGAESLKRTFLQPAPDLIKENFRLSNLTRHVVDRLQLADRKYETTKDDDVSSCGLFVLRDIHVSTKLWRYHVVVFTGAIASFMTGFDQLSVPMVQSHVTVRKLICLMMILCYMISCRWFVFGLCTEITRILLSVLLAAKAFKRGLPRLCKGVTLVPLTWERKCEPQLPPAPRTNLKAQFRRAPENISCRCLLELLLSNSLQ